MGKQASRGSTSERSGRSFKPSMRGLGSTLERGLLGQLAEPPETAVSVPLQQATSNLQAGLPRMRENFGLGGGLVNQLTGRGVGGPGNANLGSLLPTAPQGQFGLQSRAQLGLPDRESYFPLIPSIEELQAAGAVPPVVGTPGSKKLAKKETKLENRIERRQAKGKGTAKAERKLANVRERQAG